MSLHKQSRNPHTLGLAYVGGFKWGGFKKHVIASCVCVTTVLFAMLSEIWCFETTPYETTPYASPEYVNIQWVSTPSVPACLAMAGSSCPHCSMSSVAQ